MTTKQDWLFRADTLREAAIYMRNRAAEVVVEAKRYEALAERASFMALQSQQHSAQGE